MPLMRYRKSAPRPSRCCRHKMLNVQVLGRPLILTCHLVLLLYALRPEQVVGRECVVGVECTEALFQLTDLELETLCIVTRSFGVFLGYLLDVATFCSRAM